MLKTSFARVIAVTLAVMGSMPTCATTLILVKRDNKLFFAASGNETKPGPDGTWILKGEDCKLIGTRNIVLLHSGNTTIVRGDGTQVADITGAIRRAINPSLSLERNEKNVIAAAEAEFKKAAIGIGARGSGPSPLNQILLFGGFDSKKRAVIEAIGVFVIFHQGQPVFFVGKTELFPEETSGVALDVNGAYPIHWTVSAKNTQEALVKALTHKAAENQILYGGSIVSGSLTLNSPLTFDAGGGVCTTDSIK